MHSIQLWSYPIEGGGRDWATGKTKRCRDSTICDKGLALTERISGRLSQEAAGRQRSASQRERASARQPARCKIDRYLIHMNMGIVVIMPFFSSSKVITYLNDEITRSQVGIRKSPTTAAVSIPSQQPLHLYTPQRAPTSAFKSPISAISMTGTHILT